MHTRSHIIALTFLLIFPVCLVFAQNGYLKGTIKHAEGPLRSATVLLGTQTMLSNQDGEFSFSLIPGSYKLTITHSGYKAIMQEIKIEAGVSHVAEFLMTPVEPLDEVVVVGSRSDIQRSSMNTAVPIDVFTSKQLVQTGQNSLTQMLNFTAPSFNASREIQNEPATLRNLDPQHVLILVNNIRYHNTALLYGGNPRGQLGRGSVSNDLNSIPFTSIDKIEVLRDGASAQYGSDAIAGVINIRLKETTGQTSVRLHTGQQYAGDGEKFTLGISHGFSLSKKGFLVFSGDLSYRAPTYRGGIYRGLVYYDTAKKPAAQHDSIIALDNQTIKERNFDRSAVPDNVGNFENTMAGILMNGEYGFSSRTQVFWTASLNKRKTIQEGFYRFPKNKNQVNLALFPDGFRPRGEFDADDITLIGGIKGETKSKWHWSLGNSYGSNGYSTSLSNANNPSQSYMGKNAPTTFYCGKRIYRQATSAVNFSKAVSKPPFKMRSLNLGMGAEWRLENYQSRTGDSASWYNYDSTGKTQAGVGNGVSPANAKNKSRNVLGSYVELEAVLNDHLLIDMATRFEYYSDYGGNLAAKLAARYQVSGRFGVRASIGNGFRAPSLQQRYNGGINSVIVTNATGVRIPAIRGNFPNDHEVVKALGVPSLTAEKSINISGGITSRVSERVSMTVDAYWIQIKDRIVLSGRFDRSTKANGVDSILSKFPDLKQVDQVSFYSNAINTRTRGIDVVLNGNWKLSGGLVRIMLAANFNRTNIYGIIQSAANLPADSLTTSTLFSRLDRGIMEIGQPSSKVILNMIYYKGRMAFNISNTCFGKTGILNEFTKNLDEFFSPKVLTDISITYSPKTWLAITGGVNNLFDVYPDRFKYYENTVEGSQVYSPEASPFGFNGGYYYVGMNFRW